MSIKLRKRVFFAVFIIFLFCVVAAFAKKYIGHWQQPLTENTPPIEKRVQWYVQKAKAANKKEIILPAPHIDYGGNTLSMNLDKALSFYSLIVAEPYEEHQYLVDDDKIVTWYKFKIDEKLFINNKPACPFCTPPLIPADLQPIGDNEFVASKNGGSIVIDGVKVTTYDESFPQLQIGRKYLLFVSMYPSKVAEIGMGHNGVFDLTDNENMRSINDRFHPVKKELNEKFGNSLSNLRTHINSNQSKNISN